MVKRIFVLFLRRVVWMGVWGCSGQESLASVGVIYRMGKIFLQGREIS